MFQSEAMTRVMAAESASWAAASACKNPDDIPAGEAVRLYETLERGVRALTAAKTILARRVKDSQQWKRAGHSSAAEHLASMSGRSLGAARGELDTSEALDDLAATKDALLAGDLSEDQGRLIANAAKANPKAERRLIRKARKTNHRASRTRPRRPRRGPTRTRTLATSGSIGNGACRTVRTWTGRGACTATAPRPTDR